MKKFFFAIVLVVPLCGCTTIASTTSSVATYLSSPSPTQATTLAEAIQAATLVTNAVDVYVRTGVANRGTLLQLQALNNGVHQALLELESKNKLGGNLNYDIFNAALKAYNSYTTTIGVKK